jgi:hypothetical protein
MSDFNENEDLSDSLAATLTDSVGLQEDGSGDISDSLAADLTDQETWQAEKDLPVSNDVQDTAQGVLDREAEQDQANQRGRKVPLAALHEERTKRQALELQLQAQAQQLQQLMAQQQAAQQAQLQAQQEAAIPDFDEDPRGYIEAKERQFAQALEQLQGQGQQRQQIEAVRVHLQQEVGAVAPVLVESEARFAASHPDYEAAAHHVQAHVEANMRAQHPGVPEEQLALIRTATLVQYTKQCQARGIDPAEHLYGRAQELGFKTASRAPRREPNTSLSTLHGSARAPDERGAVRASDIADMTEAEFDKYWASMRREAAIGPAF